jgi:hypothetical protein
MKFISRVFALAFTFNLAEASDSFIQSNPNFSSIQDPYRQAEAWATCSVVWDYLGQSQRENNPAGAEQFFNTSRGSELAIAISQMDYLLEKNTYEIIAEKFNSTWKVGQMMMESLPESASAVFYSEINRSVESGNIDEVMKKIETTSLICQMNLETQKYYIDLWRQMMKEGLLQ